MNELKPNKNVECPPFDRYYPNWGGCFSHSFGWVTTSMGQYRQEVCQKCGVSGRTEKVLIYNHH